LVAQAAGRTGIPILAAGGIMFGEDVWTALSHGAQAAQMGTAFLLTPEAGISAPYQQKLESGDPPTALTRAFTGRWARGLKSACMRGVRELDAIAPHPVQRILTAPIRAVGDPDYMQMWAGQGYSGCRPLPAAALIGELAREFEHGAHAVVVTGRKPQPNG